ncbi:Altered inheritance of mitochondria protein 9, mitochondrial [Mycena indigotica]|uniref:Altered inheritance of mitochondria protein 9, mitochondrial n=1 Tax=Mycena indigotica TaxID=2126181 RepID=A0A8H6RWY9_9AGAR|nr:Altered inheritance of mitochondria protein 9, mitochondrial [Mycena indigotica]KAF7289310.1 Altered inheritance of mitochondria protein 9, mitochondrial [Mycena indigotica]
MFGVVARSVRGSSMRYSGLKLCNLCRGIYPSNRQQHSSSSQVANSDLFDYTEGRWLFNDALRLAERKRVFNVRGLLKSAASSVQRTPDDVQDIRKLAEGGYNRVLLITMRDGFKMVARIPYPISLPRYFMVASEVATMDYLRTQGIPTPQVYGYSPTTENEAETEYILMEFVEGSDLGSFWSTLSEPQISSVTRQIAKLEATMMSLEFPAGGGLYYTKDLEAVSASGVPLEGTSFSVGPDIRATMWKGKRPTLAQDVGPYLTAEASLLGRATNELAFVERFGQPLLPFRRWRREAYGYQKQDPSDYIQNLQRYLLVAPFLLPPEPASTRFGIRHLDLKSYNIIVSQSDDGTLTIKSLIDWHHVPILPQFLLAGVPPQFQNHDDPVWDEPSLPANIELMDEMERNAEHELYRHRLVHYHYIANAAVHNEPHFNLIVQSFGQRNTLCRSLFVHSSRNWEGDTNEFKTALMQVVEDWDVLTGNTSPCPISFEADDVRATMEVAEYLKVAELAQKQLEQVLGDGWVPANRYEELVAHAKKVKDLVLNSEDVKDDSYVREALNVHWPYDDMDEISEACVGEAEKKTVTNTCSDLRRDF